MTSPRVLLEDSFGTFRVDRSHVVAESVAGGGTIWRFPGRLSLCDTVNGNKRRYRRTVWERNLSDGSMLVDAIKRNAAFGLLEHPKDGHVDLLSPIAISVTKAKLVETTESGKNVFAVDGEITIINTPEGKRLSALIEAGWDPTVSSRGYGSLSKAEDGIDEVQDDYVCEGWDVVLKPSFVQAVCTPERSSSHSESKAPSISVPAPIRESIRPPSPSQVTSTSKSMIQEIRARLAALKGIDPRSLTPKSFAEGINQMQTLHDDCAAYLVEDARASWNVTKLHEEISQVEAAWSAAQAKPAVQAAKLQEDKSKLLKVTQAVVQVAGQLRRKLGEKVQQAINLQDLLEKTIARGKFWKERAERTEAKLDLSERRLDFACKGLERIAERYKDDMTVMGKRVIVLEFKDKVEAPEIKEALDKAVKPKDLMAIRAVLEGKKAPAAPVTENVAPTVPAPTAPAPVNESVPAPAPTATTPVAPAPIKESAVRGTLTKPEVLTNQYQTGPTSISESVAVAQRLSQQAAVKR